MNDYMNKLTEVFLCAITNSRYYKQKAIEKKISSINEFKVFPIMNREELRDNRDSIFSDEYSLSKTKLMRSVRTSGSTGQFVEAFWTNRDYFASNLCLWRKRMEWYGITPASKKCSFFTRERYKSSKIDGNINVIRNDREIQLSCTHMKNADLEKYYEEMQLFKPEWIYITPSVLMHLLTYWDKSNKSKIDCIKYIELFGENVNEGIKVKAKSFFPNANIGVMYGTQEVNGIALTCKHGCLHVLEDNVFLESDEENNAIVTSLKNREFPIIRYRNGDKIKMGFGCCPCGCKGQYIEKLLGRSTDFLIIDSTNGLTIHAIKEAIHVTDTILDYPILQYKVSKDEIINIYLLCDDKFVNWKSCIQETLSNNLEKIGLSKNNYCIVFCEEPIEVSLYSGKIQ